MKHRRLLTLLVLALFFSLLLYFNGGRPKKGAKTGSTESNSVSDEARAEPKPSSKASGGKDPKLLSHESQFDRVREARKNKGDKLAQFYEQAKVPYPGSQVFIRIFKDEDILELWAQPKPGEPFALVQSYPICAKSGSPGPKRREGDMQVPEGFYKISWFNPQSNFHLGLLVNYPNESDRILSDPKKPGGEIMIHGDCLTIGCIPITNDLIEEVYLASLDSFKENGKYPAVHIFPAKLDEQNWPKIKEWAEADSALLSFWSNLREGYLAFEKTRLLPSIRVDQTGRYLIESGR